MKDRLTAFLPLNRISPVYIFGGVCLSVCLLQSTAKTSAITPITLPGMLSFFVNMFHLGNSYRPHQTWCPDGHVIDPASQAAPKPADVLSHAQLFFHVAEF